MKSLHIAVLCVALTLSSLLLWGCGECDHDFGEWETDPAATCITSGTQKRVCRECDFEETGEIEALGHTEIIDRAVAPTCTEDGNTEGKHCEVCGTVLKATETLAALGHTEVIDEAVVPTCTEDGNTEGKHCEICNEIIEPTEVIPALGHKYIETVKQEASCLGKGITDFLCETCGDGYTEEIEYPAYTATEIHELVKGSVAEIITYDKNGDGLSLGSGFVYNGNIITNYHVIEGAYSAQVSINGKTYNATKVIAYDKDIDLAVISVDTNGDELKSLKICTNNHAVGAEIYAVGSSKGFTDTFSNGIISNSNREFDGVYYVQHTAAISSGNSGGPLLNQFCEVIGVNTLTIIDSQNLNMAVNAGHLSDLNVENLTFPEFYKKECDPISILGNYAVNYGEYASEYGEYGVLVDTRSFSDYISDFYYYFDPKDGSVEFWYQLNDAYCIALYVDKLGGSYEWVYYFEDYYISGYINPAKYTPTASLSASENNFTSYSLYSEHLQIANVLMRSLCQSFDEDLSILGVSAADLGFTIFNGDNSQPETNRLKSGKYSISGLQVNGIYVSYNEMIGNGIENSYFHLYDDGTFSFVLTGEQSYSATGSIDTSASRVIFQGTNESYPYTVNGNSISITFLNTATYIFTL